MLFAACTSAAPTSLQRNSHAPNNLGQQQLTSLQQLKDMQVTALSSAASQTSKPLSSSSTSGTSTPMQMSPQHHGAGAGTGNAAVAVSVASRANEEAKEAMRKLDATLVAYLAGETKLQPKQMELEPKLDLDLNLNSSTDPSVVSAVDEYDVFEEFSDAAADINNAVESLTCGELHLFRCIKSVKLQLEALTLEPEGTKRMELLRNDTRPIFTVECQLSHELIKHVPRYEMFHIMQFESEKFHSLTQCTRFGQEAQRDINLTPLIDELDGMRANNHSAVEMPMPNFGRIHFTVWWREPGTCLNEMLGMGVFELRELYDAALLEQCKRITIQRRGEPLANIYLKINLLLGTLTDTMNNNSSNIIRQHHPGGGDKQQQQQQQQENSTDNNAGNSAGDSGAAQSAAPAAPTSSAANSSSNNTANPGDNNNLEIEANSTFNAATLKVRLLTGMIYAFEVRNMPLCSNRDYSLLCEGFWNAAPAAATATEGLPKLCYQEQFAVIRDANFLNCCKRNQLKLKILQGPQKKSGTLDTDSNANIGDDEQQQQQQLLGTVSLPLKKFFVAFSNDMMANRMVTEKLPVIAIDDWVPILNEAKEKVGEMKCLLAIGSELQIKNLKATRNLTPTLHSDMFGDGDARTNKTHPTEDIHTAVNVPPCQPKSMQRTSDLMEMLQQALQQTQNRIFSTSETSDSPLLATGAAADALARTAAARLQERTFQFELVIECADSLPTNPIAKGKMAAKRLASKRFPPGEAPSTYVTFQADICSGGSGLYNSHEGKVYATDVVERNTNPRWAQRFFVTVGSEYLENPNQNFILKLWKKANVPPANGNGNGNGSSSITTSTTTRLLPKPCDDAILGFTSLDLSAFMRGMHIGGIFNVIDFNGRVNGRLYLNAKPMAGWCARYSAQQQLITQQQHHSTQPLAAGAESQLATIGGRGDSMENVFEQFENTLDLDLGQAVKEKYNELEGISKRLRARLSNVTGQQLQQHVDLHALDDWQPFGDVMRAEQARDNELQEFERDINTNAEDDLAAIETAVEMVVGDNESDNNKKQKLISASKESTAVHDSAVD